MRAIRQAGNDAKVILITRYLTLDLCNTALELGVAAVLETEEVLKDEAYLVSKVEDLLASDGDGDEDLVKKYRDLLVARSPAMVKLLRQIQMVKDTEVSVLITGETGVGKGAVARAIHDASQRRVGKFVTVECTSVPESLFESHVFGYVKGAFTGADRDKEGVLEEAHQGTLFLDEINSIPLHVQSKLLRAVEEKIFRRLGDTGDRSASFRVLSAANESLPLLIQRGRFREDLFSRLAGFRMQVPPLRERREDIPFLIEKFISTKGVSTTDKLVNELTHNFDWKSSNARQLKNTLDGLIAVDSDGVLGIDDLANYLKIIGPPDTVPDPESPCAGKEHVAPGCPILREGTLEKVKEAAARTAILRARERYKNNWREIAKHLDISKSSYFELLDKYGIKKSEN
jgi:DNA-binding NtrC family response regulator